MADIAEYWVHSKTLHSMILNGEAHVCGPEERWKDDGGRFVNTSDNLPIGQKFQSPPVFARRLIAEAVSRAMPRGYLEMLHGSRREDLQKIASRVADEIDPMSDFRFILKGEQGCASDYCYEISTFMKDKPAVPLVEDAA